MTRRRVLCGLLLVSAVLACFAGWLVIANRGKMTRARFEQVKKGMSLEEVIRTVGGPPHVVDGHPMSMPGGPVIPMPSGGFSAHWFGEDASIIVVFDDAGNVTAASIRAHSMLRGKKSTHRANPSLAWPVISPGVAEPFQSAWASNCGGRDGMSPETPGCCNGRNPRWTARRCG
jgi:hypothetical protein